MALNDINQRVLVKYKVDATEAKSATRDYVREVEKISNAAKNAGKSSSDWMGVLSKGNQVMELYGKTLGFATKGLDAYAKSSASAAFEVGKIKGAASSAMETLQASIGRSVVTMAPMIDGMSRFVSLLNEAGAAGPLAIGALGLAITGNPAIAAMLALGAAGGYNDVSSVIFDPKGYADAKRAQAAKGAAGALAAVQGFEIDPLTWKKGGDIIGDAIAKATARGLGIDSWSGSLKYSSGGGGKGSGVDMQGRRDSRYALDTWRQDEGRNVVGNGRGGNGPFGTGVLADGAPMDEWNNQVAITEKYNETLAAMRAEMQKISEINNNKAPAIDRIVGSLDELHVAKAAYAALTETIQGTYDALVTGAEPAGKALKRLAAAGVHSIGKEMLAGGIHYEVKTIAALASYNYPQAAMFQVTAAKYFAGAAAVGLIANQMGGGGGGSGGGGSARSSGGFSGGNRPSAPYSGGNNGNNSGERSSPTIVVGSAFAYDSPRNQVKNAKRLVTLAAGTNSVVYG